MVSLVLAVALPVSMSAATAGQIEAPGSNGGSSGPIAVAVPEGDGTPVITDGLFTAGEWDDALRVDVADGVTLHLKEFRGVVFIGVRGQAQAQVGPSEFFLAVPGGPIAKLHVSAQLGETLLPPAGEHPPFRFGLTTDWYANELRRDADLAAQLQKEGKTPMEVITASSYPSDGIEVAIRRSKLPGDVWLLRLWSSAFLEGKPSSVVYPPGTGERVTDRWLELRHR